MKTTQDFIKHTIECLNARYSNAIPVFGGALWVYDGNNFNSKRFVSALSNVASDAKFFKWHEGTAGAMRRFCRICMVDPTLIEATLGTTFDEICARG